MSNTILVVDDEKNIRDFLKLSFEKKGCDVYIASTVDEAIKIYDAHYLDLVITDYKLTDKDGFDLISYIVKQKETTAVIMMTAYGDVEIAVKAMKSGARDFITKPFEFNDLYLKASSVFELISLKNENDLNKIRNEKKSKYHNIIGESSIMLDVYELIKKVSPLPSTVMITGETGTGKELVAKAIHDNSDRKQYPFIALNCTTFTESLLESELFGYEKGSFTDAKQTKKGLFELSDKGTIVFDEIGDMPVNLQAKLLRVIQEKKIRRIGGEKDISVDVRIISSTNKNLKTLVNNGLFRDDLYFRLNVFPIELPPLRKRDLDIILLAEVFLLQFAEEFGKTFKGFDPEVKQLLLDYTWPGNIRELKNMVERLVILSNGPKILVSDLPLFFQNDKENIAFEKNFKDAKNDLIIDFEKKYIIEKLLKTNGNVTKAANISGLDRTVLQRYMKQLGIDSKIFKNKY